MTDTLLALDPGGTTGYTLRRGEKWVGGQLGPGNHHRDLWDLLHALKQPSSIICERFDYEIRRDAKNTYDVPGIELVSRNYIGVVELFCELTKVKLYMSPRSVLGVEWVKDTALKKMGLYVPGKPHQNDSARHLIYHMVQIRNEKTILERLRTDRYV